MKAFLFVLGFLTFGSTYSQLNKSDFTGQWTDDDSGWWISIQVTNDSVTVYKCYDGKTLKGTAYHWRENSLEITLDYFLDFRKFKLELVDKKRMSVIQMECGNCKKMPYTRISDKFVSDEHCFLN